MGSWNFSNIGTSARKHNREYIKQVMECFNITFDCFYESEAGIIHEEFNPSILGNADKSQITPLELYCLLNEYFGETYVYYAKEKGNNTSDYYYRKEEIYNPTNGQKMVGLRDYCYGDGEVFGQPVEDYCGIEFDDEDDSYWDKLPELGTKKSVSTIKAGPVRNEIKEKLLEVAKKKNYTELITIISQKKVTVNNIDNTSDLNNNESRIIENKLTEEIVAGRNAFLNTLRNELERVKSVSSDSVSNYEPQNEIYFNQAEEVYQMENAQNKLFRKIAKIRENLMLNDLNSNPFEAFIGEMEVQGTAYEGRSDRIEYLKVGDAVQLVREPANAYNTLNISVRNKNGESLGNLEKEFCDAFAPLIDEGILKFREASVLSVEPLSKRGPRAKKAYLHISFAFDFDEKLKENTCLVYLVGGDQTNIWAQKIRAYVCLIPIAHMKMIFEIYNRFSNEYDLDNNNVFYVGLDNLAAEVIKAREKMRSEMKSGLSYEKVDEESECFYEYLMKRIKEEKERYQDLVQYTDIFEDCENDHDPFFMDALFSCLSLGLVDTYWIDQTQVTETEFDDEFYGFNHWYEIAEVFDANECIFDFSDEDVVGIFGSDKFKAFIDLSYGC